MGDCHLPIYLGAYLYSTLLLSDFQIGDLPE